MVQPLSKMANDLKAGLMNDLVVSNTLENINELLRFFKTTQSKIDYLKQIQENGVLTDYHLHYDIVTDQVKAQKKTKATQAPAQVYDPPLPF